MEELSTQWTGIDFLHAKSDRLPLKIDTWYDRGSESIEPSSLNMQISKKGFAKKLENYAKKSDLFLLIVLYFAAQRQKCATHSEIQEKRWDILCFISLHASRIQARLLLILMINGKGNFFEKLKLVDKTMKVFGSCLHNLNILCFSTRCV